MHSKGSRDGAGHEIIKDAESAKKDLKSILPKGFGAMFYGDPASWPSFRKIFESCLDLDPTVSAATMKNLIGDSKLKKSVKSLRTGRDVLDELNRQLGHAFLNSQSILEEVKQAREATTPEEEKSLVTLMKNAKRSLSMQDDPMAEQTLLTIPLLITWLQKLLTPNQDALMIILQDTDFGKTSSPITPYFEYLDKLDERISIAVRHRAVRNPGRNKGPGYKDDRSGDGGKKYGNTRTLAGAYEISPHGTAGCTTFCKTGPAHKPAYCPRFKNGEITEATLHKKKLCTGCLGPKDGCPQNCKNKKTKDKAGRIIWKTCLPATRTKV